MVFHPMGQLLPKRQRQQYCSFCSSSLWPAQKDRGCRKHQQQPVQTKKHSALILALNNKNKISYTASSFFCKILTSGWKFYNIRTLYGVKFHLYEHKQENTGVTCLGGYSLTIWTFACFFDLAPNKNHALNMGQARIHFVAQKFALLWVSVG